MWSYMGNITINLFGYPCERWLTELERNFQIIGIDAKHDQIQCSLNYLLHLLKHFSMVLLAWCDANYKFIWVNVGAYSSEHDAGVFRRKKMGTDLESGKFVSPSILFLVGSRLISCLTNFNETLNCFHHSFMNFYFLLMKEWSELWLRKSWQIWRYRRKYAVWHNFESSW